MKSVSEIRDAIQTFSAHAHSCDENIDSILDICMAILDVVANLNHAREATNGTIDIHTNHLTMCSTDILSLTHKVNDLVEDADLYAVDTRDYFAAAALTGLLAHRGVVAPSHPTGEVRFLVEDAYHVADAMLAARGDKPAFQPQKFTANYSGLHKFDFWKMSGLKHTSYPVCKCGFSENNAIHLKENQDVNSINGQPKPITIEFADQEEGEQAHGYDLDGAKETPIEASYDGSEPE